MPTRGYHITYVTRIRNLVFCIFKRDDQQNLRGGVILIWKNGLLLLLISLIFLIFNRCKIMKYKQIEILNVDERYQLEIKFSFINYVIYKVILKLFTFYLRTLEYYQWKNTKTLHSLNQCYYQIRCLVDFLYQIGKKIRSSIHSSIYLRPSIPFIEMFITFAKH